MGLFNDKQESIFDFSLDETAKANLLETARWGKFLAIISLVSAFLVMILTFAAVAVGERETVIAVASYGVVALFYIYPLWALYKFSVLSKQGILTQNKIMFNDSLRYLKGMFRYLGIVTIIGIAFAALGVLLAMLGAFMADG